MTFSLSGSTITQNGTDADLSGLAAIAGVQVISENGHAIYNVGDRQLQVRGSLSLDPEVEELVFGANAPFQTLLIPNGGHLTVGQEIAIGASQNRFSSGTWVRFTDASTDSFRESEASLRVGTGGRLDWFGGALYTNNPVAFMEGSLVTLYSQQCQIIFQTFGIQVRQRSENFDVRGMITRGGFLTLIANPARLAGWQPFDTGNQAVSFSSASPDNQFYIIENFNTSGLSGQHVAFWSNVWGRLVGSDVGTGVIAGGNSNSSNTNRGLYEIRQPVRLTVRAFSGAEVDGVKVYCQDTDNGNRLPPSVLALNEDYRPQRVYTHQFDASGQHTFDADGGILTGVVYKRTGAARNSDVIYDRRSRLNDATDTFRFAFYRYGFGIGVLDARLVGLGGSDLSQTLFDDLNITEPDLGTVLAYVRLANARQLYDAYAAFLSETYSGEESFALARSGDTIDAGGFDVDLVDSGPAFSLAGNTLTVNTGPVFTGSITTTGLITNTGVDVVGVLTDANGTRATFTLEVTGLPPGADVALYLDDGFDPQFLGALLATAIADASGVFSYRHASPGDLVHLQVISAGLEEFNQTLILQAANQSISVQLTEEVNL